MIVQPVVEPMDRCAALINNNTLELSELQDRDLQCFIFSWRVTLHHVFTADGADVVPPLLEPAEHGLGAVLGEGVVVVHEPDHGGVGGRGQPRHDGLHRAGGQLPGHGRGEQQTLERHGPWGHCRLQEGELSFASYTRNVVNVNIRKILSLSF